MKAKQYKNHSDVPSEYKWDLEDILQGKSIEEIIDEYKNIFKQRIQTKETKYQTIEAYIADLKLSEKQSVLVNKIDNYISNNLSSDLTNAKYLKLENEFKNISHDLLSEFGSETNRFFKNIEKLKLWKEDPRLKSYKIHIEETIKEFKHKLDDNIEEYLLQTSIGTPDPHSIFSILTNSELDYGFIEDSKGNKHKLNKTNRVKFSKSDDKKLRKGAYQNFWNAYLKHKDSLSEILFQHFKAITTDAKIRKYKSAVDMLTSSDKVSDEILQKLFLKVAQSKHLAKKYNDNYKKFYKQKFNEKMEVWDTSRELLNIKSSYTVHEMNDIVQKALKPFGEEYSKQIEKALTQNWVDYMSTETKRGGAYSIGGTYGIDKKYILMNFEGTLSSVETLAHELGHSMHSYYSDKHNDIQNASYPIFLAEIASIFNEFMLFDYLLKSTKSDAFKFKILSSIISGFFGTVNKQILWANFEYDLYKGIADGSVSSSYESISKVYFENAKKYSNKKSHKYTVKDNLQCIYVPHYYYGFYVYKYAVGQLVASYFFKQYQNQGKKALENYIANFLSAGGSDYPLNILKKVGVDLLDDNFYKEGFSYIENLINQWIKLGKKIFKN
ncbi:oligoendopeptidase F [Mycoplasma leonicaptivi]|uniref:oligoendopeptidase F n=1 Tax=Mycoplasma leonicaptivi TaxID=36742 RepID=UPI0004893E91|nr:oligoendopeptidase F [Mycoplasma leonicaptivi]